MTESGSAIGRAVGRRRRASGNGVPVWFGIPFVLMGLAAVVLGVAGAFEQGRLDADGVTVVARVTELTRTTGGEDGPSYHVHFEFVDPATLSAHDGTQSIGSADFARLRVGSRIRITFLPSDPTVARLGEPPFGDNPGPIMAIGFGAVFALIGAGVTVSAVRSRRRRAAAPGEPAGDEAGRSGVTATLAGPALDVAPADRARVDVFTRSAGRVLLDGLGPPIGGVGFLIFALVLAGQAAWNPLFLLFAAMPAFFGLLLLSAIPAIIRRGFDRTMLLVGPDGIDHVDAGLLGWPEIAELRLEHNVGSAGEAGLATYARLGVVPRDPSVAASIPGGLSRRLAGGFIRFANSQAARSGKKARMTDVAQIAPLGVYAYELEQPLAELVASIRRFAPVVERAGVAEATAREPAPTAPAAQRDGPLTDEELRELDAVLGRPSAVRATADLDPILHPAPPAAPTTTEVTTGPRVFVRRGAAPGPLGAVSSAGDALSALGLAAVWLAFTVIPLVFLVAGVASLARGRLIDAVLFAVIPIAASLVGLYQLLLQLGRLPKVTGDPELLRVGPDGITAKGLGHLAWGDVDLVRVDSDGELVLRPGPGASLDERAWADRARERLIGTFRRLVPGRRSSLRAVYTLDLGLLDTEPDEVIDAIAAYTLVEEG